MTKTSFILFLFCSVTAFSQQKNQKLKSKKSVFTNKSIQTYKFDTLATVIGCADILLQKISKDRKFELIVELSIDSLPKQKEIEISEYIKYITITLNQYPKDNQFIDGICSDIMIMNQRPKTPIVFKAISGSLTITRYSDNEDIISSIIKNVTVKNKKGETLTLPFECFKDLIVNWIGG